MCIHNNCVDSDFLEGKIRLPPQYLHLLVIPYKKIDHYNKIRKNNSKQHEDESICFKSIYEVAHVHKVTGYVIFLYFG